MKCILLGATRGCGLETMINLIQKGHSCYLLLRSPEAFEETLKQRDIASASEKSLIHLVKGDAFKEEDVKRVFLEAGEGVEFVLFSLGGRPTYKNPLSPKLSPPQICSRTTQIFLPIFTSFYPDRLTQPRLVVISSNGLGAQGHKDLPCSLKPLYGWLLKEPHVDKEEMEKLIHAAAGMTHQDFHPVLGNDDEVTLGNIIIVRPALLTDGAKVGGIRAGERLQKTYTISRKDVGAFIAEECLEKESQWRGKGVTIAY